MHVVQLAQRALLDRRVGLQRGPSAGACAGDLSGRRRLSAFCTWSPGTPVATGAVGPVAWRCPRRGAGSIASTPSAPCGCCSRRAAACSAPECLERPRGTASAAARSGPGDRVAARSYGPGRARTACPSARRVRSARRHARCARSAAALPLEQARSSQRRGATRRTPRGAAARPRSRAARVRGAARCRHRSARRAPAPRAAPDRPGAELGPVERRRRLVARRRSPPRRPPPRSPRRSGPGGPHEAVV